MKKIALEEHFLPPFLVDYWEPTVAGMPRPTYDAIKARLFDCGELRLADMDRAGIAVAVLSVAGPGVQVEKDAAVASRLAREANDFLAEMVARHPTRYQGFAHVALQDPRGAADELDRAVRELGFRGALINGQTLGHYLDEDRFSPFWERAEDLGVPVYLHPADPERTYAALEGQRQLRRPTWEWTVETASHALRMVFNGTFDRFPKATLILGHMGETIRGRCLRRSSAGMCRSQSRVFLPTSP
jgi:2,3-dihydroxybenzoate decarboxylase